MKKSLITALAVPLVVAGLAGPASADKLAPKPAPNEHITITFTVSTPQSAGVVVATGPIAGSGTAAPATKGAHVGRVRVGVDTLTIGADTVKLRGVNSHGHRKLDATTCTTTETGKGRFSIAGGTGAYAKAKGHGKFTVTSTVIASSASLAPMKLPVTGMA